MRNLIADFLMVGLSHTLNGMTALLPGSGVGHSAGAGSPFSNYTAKVTVFVLLVGFLVSVLLIGGFLVLNLGLLSKRKEDRVGGRTPSDVGVLRHIVWPNEPSDENRLPAEDEEQEIYEDDRDGYGAVGERDPKEPVIGPGIGKDMGKDIEKDGDGRKIA